jgi:hypothetical protein
MSIIFSISKSILTMTSSGTTAFSTTFTISSLTSSKRSTSYFITSRCDFYSSFNIEASTNISSLLSSSYPRIFMIGSSSFSFYCSSLSLTISSKSLAISPALGFSISGSFCSSLG